MKKKIWILISALLALVILGGVIVYATVLSPAGKAMAQGYEALGEEDFATALTAFESAREGYGKVPFFSSKVAEAEAQLTVTQETKAQREAEEAQRLAEEAEQKRLAEAYDAAVALEEAGDFIPAAEGFEALGEYSDAAQRATRCREEEATFWANTVVEKRDALSAGAWHTVAVGENTLFYGDVRFTEAVPEGAEKVFSGYTGAFFVDNGKVTAYGENFGAAEEIASFTDIVSVAAGFTHGLFLHEDGTVTGLGSEALNMLAVEDWTGITDVAAGAFHSVSLQADGKVLAAGDNTFGQCNTEAWTQVVSVEAGLHHTVALLSDGTVVATGDDQYGQCQVSEWEDIIAIAAGANFTLGLKNDYTVVFAGDNASGQGEVTDWQDVIALAGGVYHTVALRMDGTILFAGINDNGQRPEETEAVFTALRTLEAVDNSTVGTACEYIYDTEEMLGPWLYISEQGAVSIVVDETQEKKPMRADLFSAQGSLPRGYVTKPEATGNIIKMPPEGPETMARKNRCVFGMVADFLGFTSNRKAVMMRNGIVYYNRNETSTMAVHPDGTLPCYEKADGITAEALMAEGVQDSFSFGPVLVKEGELGTDRKMEVTVKTMRAAIGYACPYHYIAVVTGRDNGLGCTFKDIAQIMQGYGCVEAYNLDGGHSTSMIFMGKEISLFTFEGKKHLNMRQMSDILGFLNSEETLTTDDPLTVQPRKE